MCQITEWRKNKRLYLKTVKSHFRRNICEKLCFMLEAVFLRAFLGHWICDNVSKIILELVKFALNKKPHAVICEYSSLEIILQLRYRFVRPYLFLITRRVKLKQNYLLAGKKGMFQSVWSTFTVLYPPLAYSYVYKHP